MRIGIDTRDLFIARTGAKTYLEEITYALPRVAPQHSFIHLQPTNYSGVKENLFSKIREHFLHLLWKQVELPILAKREKCDIIFCTDYTVPLLKARQSIPVFYDANFWANPQHYNRFWRLLLRFFTLPAAKNAPVVVTISEYARQEIDTYTGIPESKIVSIPIAQKSITQNKFDQNKIHGILKKYGVDLDHPFALHVGVMEKRKNLQRLVEAFSKFINQCDQPYQLVLVGQPSPKIDQDDSDAVDKAIRQFGLQKHVCRTGYVPDEDLPAFYQGADFFVFPTLKEGFGIPVLEAFNSCLPVLASNTTSIPEVAGDAAILFNPTDVDAICYAMMEVVSNSDLRSKLIQRGLEQAKQFSWEQTANRLVNLFEQVGRPRAV